MNAPKTLADRRRNDLLQEVAEVTGLRLINELGIPDGKAQDVGNAIADHLADHWKGQTIYFPGGWQFKCQARDWEIHKRLSRGNANDLAAEFGLSQVRIYQIHKRCQLELKRQREQSSSNSNPIQKA